MINLNDEKYQRLGQELAHQLSRSDGSHVAKSLHTQFKQDITDWFDGHILPYFSDIPEDEWPEHEFMNAVIMCGDAISFFQSVRGIATAKEHRYVLEEKVEWYSYWLLRLNLGETKAKIAAEVWLPTYQQANRKKQLVMFISVLSTYLPKIYGQLPMLSMYANTLDLRVEATTTMAFGDVGESQRLQAEVVPLEQKLDAAIQLYSTGGGFCYALESDRGLLVRQLQGYTVWYLWSEPEYADEINKGRYAGIHRILPMTYRELEEQLKHMQSDEMGMVLIDERMNEDGKIMPVNMALELVQQQIREVESSESCKAIKYAFEE